MKFIFISLMTVWYLFSQSNNNVIDGFEFTYSYEIDSINNISFQGTANLPDSTIFLLTVLNYTSDKGVYYINEHKFQVYNNIFQIEPLEIGNEYSNNFELTFQMAFPDSQPKSVIDIIGVKGKNLRGEVNEIIELHYPYFESGNFYSLTDTVIITTFIRYDKNSAKLENDDLIITIDLDKQLKESDSELKLNIVLESKIKNMKVLHEEEHDIWFNRDDNKLILECGGEYSSSIVTSVKLVDLKNTYSFTKAITIRDFTEHAIFDIVLSLGYLRTDNIKRIKSNLYYSDSVEENLKKIQQRVFVMNVSE